MTIREILREFTQNNFDLVAWNQGFINQIKKYEPMVNAWTYVDTEEWLKKLNDLLGNKSGVTGPLFGVPIGIKDIYNTIDMPTCMGSPLWKDFTPGNDARVVHNIRMDDGIVAGKTVTAEFAVHAPNETKNPWDLSLSPGTSSSGSAAAVAAGMVPLSLGTQTAGSIIRPASYCGVYGFKPSFGTIPRTGMLKTTDSLDTVGLFATNVSDCRLLFDTIRVKGLDYPQVHKFLENQEYQKIISKKWKVAVLFDQHSVCREYEPYAIGAFSTFLDDLKQINTVELEFPEFPQVINNAHSTIEIIYHKSLAYYFKKEFRNHTLISKVMYDIIEEGNSISLEGYLDAIEKQKIIAEDIDSMFDKYDIILTLSTAGKAPKFGTAIDKPDTCLIWTMAGLPVVNLPLFNINNAPFGLQVIGRKYTDYKVLNFISHLIENQLVEKGCRLKTEIG